ncbi:hypothetical protein [Thermomonospora amylolytica]|uniref:hypothetical protein n=1 Tax=Thermomonospora amylolytica TaxID=1411117 RepID=UPI000E6D4770|nr:hypothetical protein [Thermomonospora amylolytica]
MAALLVVKGDPVRGTDKHNVFGQATNPAAPPPTVPYKGVGSFSYEGTMSERLSDLLSINGVPVALTDSRSSLNPGQTAPPVGKHSGPAGSDFIPPTPQPIPTSLQITDPVGTGTANANVGSALVSVGGRAVLLDGDAIDTCDGLGVKANSTVTAETQDFVRASE